MTARWTPTDIERLKQLAPYAPASVVATELGRSMNAVKAQAQRLGLLFREGKPGRLRDWTQAEEAQLRELADTRTSTEIAELLGVTPQAVRSYASKHKIRFRRGRPKMTYDWLEHV